MLFEVRVGVPASLHRRQEGKLHGISCTFNVAKTSSREETGACLLGSFGTDFAEKPRMRPLSPPTSYY